MSQAVAAIEERRIDGSWGEVYHAGHYQQDIVNFTGRLAIERIERRRAGRQDTVYRHGRVTREGQITVGKVDSRFENLFINFANLEPSEQRRLRGQGIDPFPPTQLLVRVDDPRSWGAEEIMLFGVYFWEIDLGFTEGDLERPIPVTWHSEKLVSAIPRPGNHQGAIAKLGPGDVTTYPAAGADPDPVI